MGSKFGMEATVHLFEFQGLQQVFCESQPLLYLVSHGAECVMLNKKFYKDHIDPNMAQRLKQQVTCLLILLCTSTYTDLKERHRYFLFYILYRLLKSVDLDQMASGEAS